MESLRETGPSPIIDCIVAKCRVAGTGQEIPISFNRHTTCSGKERANRARAQCNGARVRNRIEAIMTQYLYA